MELMEIRVLWVEKKKDKPSLHREFHFSMSIGSVCFCRTPLAFSRQAACFYVFHGVLSSGSQWSGRVLPSAS